MPPHAPFGCLSLGKCRPCLTLWRRHAHHRPDGGGYTPWRALPPILVVGLCLWLIALTEGCTNSPSQQRMSDPSGVIPSLSTTHRLSPQAEERFRSARILFLETMGKQGKGSRPASPAELVRQIDSLATTFQEIYRDSPGNPQLMAYLGACRLLQSAAADFSRKAPLAMEGMALLDQAIAAVPQDLEVRFLRGTTYSHLPLFFGRGAIAEADLKIFYEAAEAAVASKKLNPLMASAGLLRYGQMLRDRGDTSGSITAWKRAAVIAADTPPGREAVQALERAIR